MRILAIDPGTNEVGFCGPDGSGTWRLNPRKKADRAERLAGLAAQLAAALTDDGEGGRANPFDFVVYETPFCRGRDATRCLWGAAGVIEAIAHSCGVGVYDVNNAALRRWATGSGAKRVKDKSAAENPMMVKAVALVGTPVHTEHEADAICLYYYVLANYEIEK